MASLAMVPSAPMVREIQQFFTSKIDLELEICQDQLFYLLPI